MTSFWSTVDPATFTELPAEEAGLSILRWWNQTDSSKVHPGNIFDEQRQMAVEPGWTLETVDQSQLIFMEGWAWLISAALVMPDPSQTSGSGWSCRTRRGKALGQHLSETELKAHIAVGRDLIHLSLQTAPLEALARGRYDSAVFEASKAVEVRVRKLAGLEDRWIGRDLMRQAFKPESGPLCDPGALKSEQESMADLFAGIIGIFKNPTSHRDEVVSSANEAAEALMTASHLMRVLDRVEARLNAGTP